MKDSSGNCEDLRDKAGGLKDILSQNSFDLRILGFPRPYRVLALIIYLLRN
jgi:hypothetical protein